MKKEHTIDFFDEKQAEGSLRSAPYHEDLAARLSWHFRDRDRAAARARFEALADALKRRGIGVHLGECDLPSGHIIGLNAGGRDGVLIIAVKLEDGTYEGAGRGNPPQWLVAHIENAWCEIA